jgi:hypothetical protein
MEDQSSGEEHALRFCISWARSLEPLKCSAQTTISDVARLSSFEVDGIHAFVTF